jgi:predicted PurR-regulated permease PerM
LRHISRSEFAYRALIVFAIGAAFFLAWKLGSVLLLVFGGMVLAVIVRMAADPLAKVLPLSERWAAVLVMVLVAAALIAVFAFFGSELAGQFQELRQRLPEALQQVRDWLRQVGLADTLPMSGKGKGPEVSLSRFASAAFTTVGFITDLILVLLIAAYLALSPSWYTGGAVAITPAGKQAQAREAFGLAGHALRDWLKGQLVSMLSVGVLVALALWLVGVPMPFMLGLIAGLLEFVPILGPWLAAVPGVLLAFTVSPTTALYAALVYLAVQQIEGGLIMPLAQRWAVRLPPALGLVAIVALGILFGLPGILFATPLTVVLMVLVKRFYLHRPDPG